ncbi:uncharacterized protein K452DRAFT_316818 [Aplosporella prunicola CBS 121167]|uniref:Glutamine amidotransferase domain-containing protein n=1 Tax=Aplosporella prunicola CBS 121167 TaxID=1176127 RepID=A0A6A6BIV6_9PEZI|nr:uncharacterized protein K452DRAFT_316818 [Aplosporella prunicola CBS 121167]KAF2144059.1 hypothetical protein K452DRAFT_316818 [Aplosporella prunicola CBS 121167]
MPHKQSSAPKIAVLVNTYRRYSFEPSTRDSFTTTILGVAPSAKIDFYDPVDAQEYPRADDYDLVVLSGGTADINAPEPWVLKMFEFIRATVAASTVKLVGVCWGHQAVHVALGGRLVVMEEPELGVTTIKLTPQGGAFFDFAAEASKLDMHQFHRRKIVDPAPEFVPLTEDNQSFMSPDNRILTFQGHPEMNAKLAQSILADAPKYTEKLTAERRDGVSKAMEREQDGKAIFERIIRWINEK